MTTTELEETDRKHLKRCVELARQALEAGDKPFGSLLVGGDGRILREDRNRASENPIHHPEIELVRWAVANLSEAERAETVVYTSGEHCPMCSAAHGWAGMGRIVFAQSTDQLTAWKQEWGAGDSPVAQLSIPTVVRTDAAVRGPFPEFAAEMKALHRQAVERDG